MNETTQELPPEPRRLLRARSGRMVGGVCAGLGRRIGLSPWLVRLLAVASLFLPGPQFIAYIALWILMPSEPR